MIFNIFVLFLSTFILSLLTALITNNNISNYIIQITVFSLLITIFFYFLNKKFNISFKILSIPLIFIILLPYIFSFTTIDFLENFFTYNKNSAKYTGKNIPDTFLKSGWYGKENNLVWGRKNTSLLIPVDNCTNNNTIFLELFAYVDKNFSPQTVSISDCSSIIDSFITKKNATLIRKIAPNKNCCKNNLVELNISSTYEVSPESQSISKDNRILGVGIKSIFIK